MKFDKHAIFLAKAGALLIFLGLVTGVLVVFAMTGVVGADPGAALAAHLNGIIGGLILLGLGFTMPMLRYEDKWKTRLTWLTIVGNYSNLIITFIKSFLHVQGVGMTEDPSNNLIYYSLTIFVVLPSLVGGLIWVLGFKKKAE